MRKLLFVLIAISIHTSSFAQQEFVYPSEDPVFSISFPSDWLVELGETSLESYPADESIYYGIVALPEKAIEDAINAADESVSGMFTDLQYDDPEEGEFNGINFVFMSGSGNLPDVGLCNIEVGVFTVDNVNFFMSLYFGTPEAEEEHAEAIEYIVNSLSGL